MSTLVDRRYLSRYASETVGFLLVAEGEPRDADGDVVTAQLVDAATDALIFTRDAAHSGTGLYSVTLTGADTQVVSIYDLRFSYTVDTVSDLYVAFLEVGPAAPAYDALEPGFRDVVEAAWVRFADLFDSPLGGPHLQTYAQSHFGRQRLAQLLRVAIGRLNTISQPRRTYGLDRDFPFDSWGPLLEQALYCEVIKHLRRSYIEQPDVVGGAGYSRLDRQQYVQRWQDLFRDETDDLERQMETFRMEALGLGAGKALISGGAYGRWGPFVGLPGGGQAAARGYFAVRRYGV